MIKNPVSVGPSGQSSKQYVTWEDPIQIEKYTKEIDKMAKELINENRKLRRIHSNIIKEVNSLKNIDLLRQRSVWDERMKFINEMVDKEIK
jgi:hypothetical protein